jgi:type 1 glutamine amidotransferase
MRTLLRLLLLLIGAAAFTTAAPAAAKPPHILIFSHSTGYRHASIEPGVAAIKAMAERDGMAVTTSEDPDVFSTGGLRGIDAIVLIGNTTKPDDPASEWFVGARRDALQAFVHRGGGIVGIHAASDSHYRWPWYGRMIGAWFTRHPKGTPEGTVTVVDPAHPATKGLTPQLKRVDEWYYFDDYDPRLHVLVTLDPGSIGEQDANPNPMSWSHSFEGGRVFYTAMGHTAESFSEPWFMTHLRNGLKWVTKR